MKPRLITNEVDAKNRLDELGWTTDELLEIVGASIAARKSCTPNHPPGTAGIWDGRRERADSV